MSLQIQREVIKMIRNEQLEFPSEPYESSGERMLAALKSAGTTGEKILRAAALSFARGLEVGRAARDEDEKKPA